MEQTETAGRFEVHVEGPGRISLQCTRAGARLRVGPETIIITFHQRTITGPDVKANYTIKVDGELVFEARQPGHRLFAYYDAARNSYPSNPGRF